MTEAIAHEGTALEVTAHEEIAHGEADDVIRLLPGPLGRRATGQLVGVLGGGGTRSASRTATWSAAA